MDINKDELRIWIAALRSGDYQQSKDNLQDANGYCCLGVACRALIPADKLKLRHNGKELLGGYPDEQPEAPKWLKEINDDFLNLHGITLSTLNDRKEHLSFKEIADLLEQYYLNDTTE